MKKEYLTCLLAAALLAGCGSAAGISEGSEATAQASAEPTEVIVESANGYGEGNETDTIRTSFFDFIVNSSSLVDSYEDITPSEGKTLLVVNITVTSSREQDATMYDSDFQIQWGGTGDEDFAVPVTYESDLASDTMFETEYTLPGQGTITKNAVYEVPSDMSEYVLMFREYFADESLGDIFTVHLKPADERSAS